MLVKSDANDWSGQMKIGRGKSEQLPIRHGPKWTTRSGEAHPSLEWEHGVTFDINRPPFDAAF